RCDGRPLQRRAHSAYTGQDDAGLQAGRRQRQSRNRYTGQVCREAHRVRSLRSRLNSMSSPRQTLSYLRRLLDERGMKPQTKRGQNFLIARNLLELLLRSAELETQDLVAEVGSGTGSLTAQLAEHAGAVLSIEIDPAFHALAKENVAERANVVLLHADI